MSLYILAILFPSQLGKHFWPDFSYINNIRIDYLAPTLYLTDILLSFYVLLTNRQLWFLNFKLVSKKNSIIFAGVVVINILTSYQPLLTMLNWIKVLILLQFIYLLANESEMIKKNLKKILIVPFLYTCILALSQFFSKSHIGGLWYLLGERPLSMSNPQVAKIILDGNQYLRAYGTFPHPNALAGVVILLGIILIGLKNRYTRLVVSIMALCTLSVTYSRTAIFSLFTILFVGTLRLIFSIRKSQVNKSKKVFLTVSFSALALILIVFQCIVFTQSRLTMSSSFEERVSHLHTASQIMIHKPFFGVGLGNYIIAQNRLMPNVDEFDQPVHSVPALIMVELGLMGSIYLIAITMQKRRILINYMTKSRMSLSIILVLVLTSLWDHYWITAHQNKIFLAFVVGLWLNGTNNEQQDKNIL